MRRQPAPLAALSIIGMAAVAAFGCTEDEPGRSVAAASAASPLIEHRDFGVTLASTGVQVRVGPASSLYEDGQGNGLLERLEQGCESELDDRYDQMDPTAAMADDSCGGPPALAQQVAHCVGLRFLTLSRSVARHEVTNTGAFRQSPADGTVAQDVVYLIDAPTTSDAASLALIAITYFQDAALRGISLLDLDKCEDDKMEATLPAGVATGQGTDSEATTTLGFVVAAATVEAVHALDETSRHAQALLASAAQARRATEPDSRRATIGLWRGINNSRLEAVRMLYGAPGSLFEPDGVTETVGGDTPTGGLAVAETAPETEADRRAEDLLRSLAVDPRLAEATLPGAVRTAMLEDFEGTFDAAPTDSAEFLDYIGIEPTALRQAAARLNAEAAVMGRPIRTRSGGTNRVYGTQHSAAEAEPAFLYARTVGAGAFDDLSGEDSDLHAPTDEYAARGVLPTIDVVGAGLERALDRADLDAATRTLIESGRLFARNLVPMRMHISTGQPLDPPYGLSEIRVRLYGADADHPERYELWLGEEGLECALRGNIEGEDCDAEEHRIKVTPSVETDGVESGLGPRYLEWTVPGNVCGAIPGCYLQDDSRVYVTQSGSPRRAIGGTSLLPGPEGIAWSRTTILPAGLPPLALIPDAISSVPSAPFEPLMSCAGLLYTKPLPLEDELVEAMEGHDDIESSFYHYLRLAEQAAQESDLLARELLQEHQELDQRAETARDTLEAICGNVINVGDLATPPVTCDACSGEPECGSTCDEGYVCRQPRTGGDFRCFPRDLASAIAAGGPELDSVRLCLGGDDRDEVNAALGDRHICMWHSKLQPGRAPCECDEMVETCPTGTMGESCPFVAPEGQSCDGVYTLNATDWEVLPDVTLGLSNRNAAPGPVRAHCEDLAKLRSEIAATGNLLSSVDASDVTRQAWLSHENVRNVAETLGFRQDLFQMATVTRGGADWLSSGTEDGGPSTDHPCATIEADSELLEYVCASGRTPNAGTSLLCGLDCSTAAARINTNIRLEAAVWALRVISGASLTGLTTGDFTRGSEVDYLRYAGEPRLWPHSGSGDGERVCGSSDHFLGGTYGGRAFVALCGRVTDEGHCVDTPEAYCEEGVSHFGSSRRLPDWFTGNYTGVSGSIISHSSESHDTRCVEVVEEPMGGASTAFLNELGLGRCRPAGVGVSGSGVFLRQIPVQPHRRATPTQIGSTWRAPDADHTLESVYNVLYAAENHDQADSGFGSRRAALPPYPEQVENVITNQMVLDGLELACLAGTSAGGNCGDAGAAVPEVRSAADFPALRRHLECVADRFDRALDSLVLVGLPRQVAEDLRNGTVTPTFRYRGEYGQTIAELRGAVVALVDANAQVASNLRAFGSELDIAQGQLRARNLQIDAAGWREAATIAGAAAECAASMSDWVGHVTSFGGRAIATCAGAAVQIVAAVALRNIEADMASNEAQIALRLLADQLGSRTDNLAAAIRNLTAGYANVSALLAKRETQREAARRAAAAVLGLERDDMGREYNVHRDMREIYNSTQTRYEAARRAAVQYGWLSRRAIEQRLGVDMSRMTDDMTLVQAPAKWADFLCTSGGVITSVPGDGGATGSSVAFVGDYIRQLRLFIESYRLDYPFQNASDVAVVSLRDDVLGVRRPCEMEGDNLLLWSSDLSHPSVNGEPGWLRTCEYDAPCVSMTAVSDTPFLALPSAPGGALLQTEAQRPLGGGRAFSMDAYAGEPGGSIASSPYWRQTVDLPAGDFVVSWYESVDASCGDVCDEPEDCTTMGEVCAAGRCVEDPLASATQRVGVLLEGDSTGPLTIDSQAWVALLDGDGVTVDRWLDSCRWRRALARGFNPRPQRVLVSFGFASGGDEDESVVWSSPQIEIVAPDVIPSAALPTAFFPTGDSRRWPVGLCEDSTGGVFRSGRFWSRSCEYVCPDGPGDTCAGDSGSDPARQRCFWETRFGISLHDIERGRLFPTGTLALGNFNYRFDSLAVNLVGTGVRDCSTVPESSVCYSSAYVPYSMRHDPPYLIRNHLGEEVEAPLFVGNIQQGKALAAERYITNPVSSADRTLLADYYHHEFRGRPLDGNFRLRVYDAPGFDWSRVEDVQLILNYRYWTRFE